jgi:uncharacterized protein
MPIITVPFCIIYLIIFLLLSINAANTRRQSGVSLGDNGNKKLLQATRAHGNFFEYTIFFILSSFLLEAYNANFIYVIIVNSLFLLGRISHVYSILKEKIKFRVVGMSFTFLTYALNIIYLICLYAQSFNQAN